MCGKKKVTALNLLLFLFLIFVFSVQSGTTAKEDKKEYIPPGMEIIQIGNARHRVPKGTKMRKEGGLIVLEGNSEYMARKLSCIEERLTGLEKQIEELKKAVDEIQKGSLAIEEEKE